VPAILSDAASAGAKYAGIATQIDLLEISWSLGPVSSSHGQLSACVFISAYQMYDRVAYKDTAPPPTPFRGLRRFVIVAFHLCRPVQ
jgi:hypothetical protein